MTMRTVPSLPAELKTKIESRQARIAIIGLGYVGLPLALLYTEQKLRVTGFDIDQRKVDTLNTGGSYIFRITPEEIAAARSGGMNATSDYSLLTEMDAIIICVPTPLNEYHEPDLSYITNTGHSIAPHLRAGQLVILESTTYPGTTEEVLVPILEKKTRPASRPRATARLPTTTSTSPSLPSAKIRATPAWRAATSRKSSVVLTSKPPIWLPPCTAQFSSASSWSLPLPPRR